MKPITIMPRRDTDENWMKYNPVLKENEICVVYTNWYGTMYKLGDGKRPYSDIRFTPLGDVLKRGVIYSEPNIIKFKGFINQVEEKEEIEEQVYCSCEFVW